VPAPASPPAKGGQWGSGPRGRQGSTPQCGLGRKRRAIHTRNFFPLPLSSHFCTLTFSPARLKPAASPIPSLIPFHLLPSSHSVRIDRLALILFSPVLSPAQVLLFPYLPAAAKSSTVRVASLRCTACLPAKWPPRRWTTRMPTAIVTTVCVSDFSTDASCTIPPC